MPAVLEIKDTMAKSDRYQPESGRTTLWENRTPGFGLRITATGARSWIVQKRLHGQMLRITLGKYPVLTVGDARDKAKKTLAQIERGEDPRQMKSEAKKAQAATFATVRTEFLERYVKRRLKESTQASYNSALHSNYIKSWESRPLHTITRREIRSLLEDIHDNGKGGKGAPARANRMRAYLSKFFAWAVTEEFIPASPISKDTVPRPAPEKTRERYLTEDEIKAVWSACETGRHGVYGAMLQLLLATGQRKGEVENMRWQDLQGLNSENPEWHKSGTTTKNGEAHVVPLSPLAVQIIKAQPQKGPYVFSVTGARPYKPDGQVKKTLDEACGVTCWRNHDLRRTVETNFAMMGIRQEVCDAVMNHKTGVVSGIRAVYQRYNYAEEKRQALEAWAGRLKQIVSGDEGKTNIVPLDAS